MPLLLVNENFPQPALVILRAAKFDVLAVTETMQGASDVAVLERARTEGRWLVTFDRDYGELVFARDVPAPPSIIFIRQEPVRPAEIAQWLIALLADPAIEQGYFITLSSATTRRRALPKST